MANEYLPRTLYEKVWDAHVVDTQSDGMSILYIDRHYIYEVCCPQAFEGLRQKLIDVSRPAATFATIDHNVPTDSREASNIEGLSKLQIDTLIDNC